MTLMLLLGTSSAWAASSFASGDVIYVDVSACSWYENDGCGPGIQLNKTGNYIKMDKVADKLYTYTFAQSVTSFNLGRVPATGTTKYNNFAGNFTNYDPSSKNVFKVNSNSNGGSWESPSFIKVYFDNSNMNWTNIYMCYGHSSYSKMNVKVNIQACGNIYYAIITDNWTDETQIAFHNSTQADTSFGSEKGSIAHRYGWLNGDVTHTYDISLDNANGKVFKPSKSTSKLTIGNNGKQIDAHLWGGDDAYAEETFSDNMCCTAPTSAPLLSKVSDIVKCGTTTTTSGTLKITTVNDGSTYYYKKGTNGSEVQISFGNNNQFTVSSTGDYYVKEVNDCGASSSWSSNVTISETNNSVSISDITGSETICADVTGQEYSITEIPDVSYAWSVTGEGLSTNSSTTNTVLISAEDKTSQVNGTLSVTVTKNGCETTIQQPKSITLIPLPTISTVPPTEGTVCTGTTISALENTLTITKSPNSTTKWYKGEDEKSSSDIVEEGQYTIKAISNTGSCVSNSSVTYTVTGITNIPTALAIDINGQTSASICGGTATINAKASGATSYTLYKGDNTEVETINGDANGVSFTVSDANTYKVKATNNCGSTGYSSDVTLTVIDIPSKPSFVTSGEVTCAEKPVNPNLSNELASGEYLVWYDASEGGTNLGSNLTSSAEDETKIYYAAVSNGTCESAERTPYTVDVEADPIEGLTLTLVDGYGNSLPLNYTYCQGDDVNVKLTYNGGIYWGEPEWNSTLTAGDMNTSGLRYDALNKKGEGTYTISNLQASGTLQVALTMCGDTKATSNVLNVNITPQAETPTVEVLLNIEKCGNDITQYGKIQINPYNAGYTYKINDTDVAPNNNGIVENLSTAGSFTLSAINSCKVSTPSAPFTISETDNKPTISISGNEKAVLYEDVMLTATATADATVKWYEGGVEKATGATYVVTSETATSKAVTAKAFLNGCESAVASHTVAFSAETCNNVADMTKIYFDATENTGFVTGNNVYVTITKSTNGSADCNDTGGANQNNYVPKNDTWWGTMTKVADENYIYEITIPNNVTINKGTTKLSFWNKSISSNSDVWEVQAILGQKISAGTNCMKLSNKTKTHNNDRHSHLYCGTWTTYANKPAISAPAVKTVSVETEPGEGNIAFSGQVVKTGCASTLTYGFAYSTDANADKSTWTTVECENEGNVVGTPFTGSISELDDNTYYVCAYITNSAGTTYSEPKIVTVSNIKTPIMDVQLKYCDANGTVIEGSNPMCKGSTAYVRLTYAGSKYPDTGLIWLADGTRTEKLTKVKELEITGLEAEVWSFEIQGNEQISVELKNEENTDWVASEKLSFEMVPEALSPTISYDKAIICSNDPNGATLKLDALVEGQTYELWKYTNDKLTESAAVEGVDAIVCISATEELGFAGLKESGKYFVKAYTADCTADKASSNYATLEVVNASDVYIRIVPETAETTPWMPVKLTIDASGNYNVTASPDNAIINKSGDICKVKLPLPETGTSTDCHGNVLFSGTDYTVTATLTTSGGDNPCAVPANATIRLTPYIEPCTTELPACN